MARSLPACGRTADMRRAMARIWETLEEGLAFVLDKLWRHRQLIASYKSKAKLIWWCGHFQTSFDGGPTLSASLLSRLGEFGADLFIDNFFSEQPHQSRESQT